MHRMVTSKRRIKRDGGAGGDPFGGGRGHTRMIVGQRVWSSAAHSTIVAAVGPAKPTLDGIVGWFVRLLLYPPSLGGLRLRRV